MKLDRSITIYENEDTIRSRMDAYLTSVGYKQANNQPNLVYERGSALGSLMSFTPKGWQVKVMIQINATADQATDVVVIADINTTGQLVTEKELSFWNNEIDGLENAVHTGTMDVRTVAESERTSLVQNLVIAVLMICLMIGLAVVARLILDTRLAFYVGGGIGLAIGFLIAKKWLKF